MSAVLCNNTDRVELILCNLPKGGTQWGLLCVCTCKSVSSLVSEIPYSLQQLVFGGEVVELPFCAGVCTVLGQTWGKTHYTAVSNQTPKVP